MRAAGEVRKCAVVLAEALTTGSCKLAAMFCAVVRFDASSQLYSYTHTHNCHPDSYRPSNWHLRLSVRLKGHAPIDVGSSPHFSALAPYLFPSLFLPLTQFLCAVFVCMQWGLGPLLLCKRVVYMHTIKVITHYSARKIRNDIAKYEIPFKMFGVGKIYFDVFESCLCLSPCLTS